MQNLKIKNMFLEFYLLINKRNNLKIVLIVYKYYKPILV